MKRLSSFPVILSCLYLTSCGQKTTSQDCASLENLRSQACQSTLSAKLSALSTSEAGGQISVELLLGSAPRHSVSMGLSVSDPSEARLSITSLTFTPDNWNAPQIVQLTGVDDNLADGPQSYRVIFGALESQDPIFAGFVLPPVTITNVDNDTAGITVSPISGNTSEAGNEASFTIALNSAPSSDVRINLESSDPSEGTLNVTRALFTPENWAAPQRFTVTGMDDRMHDGATEFAIRFSDSISQDEDYDGLSLESLKLTNLDNDTAGFLVSEASGNTSENGARASFTVVLLSQPTASVTLPLSSSNPGEGSLQKESLTFNSVNWRAPQEVIIAGLDDDRADGNQPYRVDFGATVSQDRRYASLTPPSVSLRNNDNDSPGIRITKVDGDTGEDGEQATFTVVLASEPLAKVVVKFDSSDPSEGTPDVTSLVFSPQNWRAPQSVTVTGQEDDIVDGDQPYRMDFSATVSDDPAYAALTPPSILLSNIDDNSAGFVVVSLSSETGESGMQSIFGLALTSQPTSDVTLNFDTDNAAEGTLDINSLTFTPQDWRVPQAVTVTGQNDNRADGDQPYSVIFAPADSKDPAYAKIRPDRIDLVNIDNDTAGFVVGDISGNTNEAGGQAAFQIMLASEPTEDVTVYFDTSDATEGTLNVTSLVFTPLDWNIAQTVTVTGQDDLFGDGKQPYRVDFSTTLSDDADYSALIPQSVEIVNDDDETAGFSVSNISNDTTEAGGQAAFTVALTSMPTDDVTVHISSSDPSEGSPSVNSLTFTQQDWNTPQTVIVTGQDDGELDGDVDYRIVFGITESKDPVYAALTPQSVDITNINDDTAGFSVSSISGNTTEAGGQATFTVVLTSMPTDDVTVSLSSSDLTEGSVDVSSLVFTPQDWSTPQTVTVTGLDDGVNDGDVTYQIDFSPATSNDPDYAALTLQSVTVTNVQSP